MSPTTAAPWASSSTSHRRIVEERLDIEVARTVLASSAMPWWKGRDRDHRDVGHFLRRRSRTGSGGRDNRRRRSRAPSSWSTIRSSSATARAADQGGRLSGGRGRLRGAGAGDDQSGARVDIVATDIAMPDMDGFELAAALRENPATASTPIVGLSAMVHTRRSNADAGRISRFRRQVRPRRARRRDEGAERRSLSGSVTMQDSSDFTEFVTSTAAGQLFGLPIACVQDVFSRHGLPRAARRTEIAGVLNGGRPHRDGDRHAQPLDLRAPDFGPHPDGDRHRGEGRIVRSSGRCAVGEVLRLPDADCRSQSINLDRQRLRTVSAGVYRLDGQLRSCSTSSGARCAPRRRPRERMRNVE